MRTAFIHSSRLIWKAIQHKRLSNYLLLLASYYWSKWTGKPHVWAWPMAISIEPTTSCNLRCPQCPSGLRSFNRPTGMLQTETFERIIQTLHQKSIYLTFYFQGEPYLNPQFLPMVKTATDLKMYVSTSTNAHHIDEAKAKATVLSGLDKLIISIDGVDQNTYSQYRVGGQLQKVLDATKALVKAKKDLKRNTPELVWQFIVFSHNEDQLPEIKRLAREYQVDRLSIKTAQIYDFEQGNDLMPSNPEYARYKATETGYQLNTKQLKHCWRLWHSTVFTWDGNIVPCCFDKDALYSMGNVQTTAFETIFKNQAYQNFRQTVLKGRQHIDICQNCSEGCTVWKH